MIAKVEALASVVSQETSDEAAEVLEVRATRGENEPEPAREETFITLDQVPVGEQRWLWGKRVPLGCITAIWGARGTGKSAIVFDMAARVSAGMPWPDDPKSSETPGSVLLVSMEDERDGSIVPRLNAAGADMSRVVMIHGADPKTYASRSFRARDIDNWDKLAAAKPDLRLVIIDAFAMFVGLGCDRRTGELAKLLARLDQFARRHKVAVVLVNATDRLSTGKTWRYGESVLPAIESWARSVWGVEGDVMESGDRFFLPARVNYAANPGGLEFNVDPESGRLAWFEAPVPMNANSGRPTARESSAVAEASRWLRGFLSGGPKPAEVVLERGELDGHSRRALYAAKKKLKVRSDKETSSFAGAWTWNLAPTAQFRVRRASEWEAEASAQRPAPAVEDAKLPNSAPSASSLPAPAVAAPAACASSEPIQVRTKADVSAKSCVPNGSAPAAIERREVAKIPAARNALATPAVTSTLGAVLGEMAKTPVVRETSLVSALTSGRRPNRRERRRKA